MKFASTLRRSQGYTIDQTILIVAIIAILVTLIIITVGWTLINKSSGTKLAAQLRQVEDANGQFYGSYKVWPHGSYTAPANSAAANMLALADDSTVTYVSQVTNSPEGAKNWISGFKLVSGVVYHGFGDGTGVVTEAPATNPFGGNGTFMVIQFTGVPFSDAKNAEAAIDNDSATAVGSYSIGRLVAVASTGTCIGGTAAALTAIPTDSTRVNVCYVGNLVQ